MCDCPWTALRFTEALPLDIFANGVDQETEPDAAIPPKTGAPGARGLCVPGVVKNGRT
jgi:hypothetical protein